MSNKIYKSFISLNLGLKPFILSILTVIIISVSVSSNLFGQTTSTSGNQVTVTYSTPGSYTFTVPAGVTSVTIQAWGGGGSGGHKNNDSRGGGGGGGYVVNTYTVSAGNTISIVVGTGGKITSTSSTTDQTGVSGQASTCIYNVNGYSTVSAGGGTAGTDNSGAGGVISGSFGTGSINGGNGANRVNKNIQGGGGGGSGPSATNANGQNGGSPGGGNGGSLNSSGSNGSFPGGGGGGKGDGSLPSVISGNGADGQVVIIYTSSPQPLNAFRSKVTNGSWNTSESW